MSDRSFHAELAAVLASGDLQALTALSIEMAGLLSRDQERRAKQAAKKRRQRGDIGGHEGTTGDKAGQVETPPEVSPYKPLPNPPERESESAAVIASRQTVERESGEEFGDVERFVATQGGKQQGEWWRFFASALTSGADSRDVGGACRDALASARPIEGLHAMRAFIAKHKQQRLESVRPPPGVGVGGAPRRTGGVGNRTFANALKALEDA